AEPDDHYYWLGGGETVIRLFATHGGVVRLQLGIGSGPCIDPSDRIALVIKDNQGSEAVVDMPAGRLVLPVQVQKGVTAVTLRPLNAKRHAVAGDPRPLLAQLRVEGFEYQPQPAATGWAFLSHVENANGCDDDSRRKLWLGGGNTILRVWAGDA